ncbi:MAG: RagB/SusD family nutrient uptake outer membrane protein [Flavobacteriaceae bacterium]|nr:RagB/SusD family nutrient uptake outer membrane protein [Flavobacteriaceae bacterium]
MKNKIKYLYLVVLVSGFVACSDLLEEVPVSQPSAENSFKTEANAIAAIVGVYNSLHLEGVYGKSQSLFTTDENNAGSKVPLSGLNLYTFTADNIEVILPIWRDHYKGINRANLAISKIPSIDMDVAKRNNLVAEAKFIKALLYFNLIRYYGDVPYKDSETTSLNDLNIPRTPVATIYENIIRDLEYSVVHLKVKTAGLAGHATQDAAKTLLASIYLTRGSMAKRDNTGNGIADFALAARYSKEVIDSNRYSLCNYFPDAFIVQNKNNDEIVFDVQFKSPGLGVGNTIGINMGIPSNASGVDNLSSGGSQGAIRANPYHQFYYEKADSIRMKWTNARILINAATGGYSIVSAISTNPPVSAAKFRRYPVRNPGFVLQTSDYDVNWPIFRFAEVLLIYAEALNETSGPTQLGIDALNKLRSRARNINIGGIHRDILPRSLTLQRSIGLVDLTLSNPLVSTPAAFRNYIILERSRELSAEGKRWFDLVRWGILKSTLRGLNAKCSAKILETPPVEVPTITNIKWTNYWNGRINEWNLMTSALQDFHMLLPIPNNERLANPSIGPNNPGYN